MVQDEERAGKTELASGQSGGGASARRAGLISWCLYDWANSAFSTIVATFIFPVYFTQMVARDPIQGATQWSYAVAAAALAAALGAPALGAVADNMGRRKPWLFAFTLLTLALTTALWQVEPSPRFVPLALAVYAAAATSFSFSLTFYNAMLRGIAPPDYLGRLSGWGWSLGYAGGLLCLVVALFGLLKPEPPPFGLAVAQAEHIRATNLLVSAWFGVFSIPIFVFTPDRPATGVSVYQAVQQGIAGLASSMGQIVRRPGMGRFLIAYMLYSNGVSTLFSFGGVYAAGVFGMSLDEVLHFGIVLNVTAGLGAAAFAWVDDLIGSKWTILIALWGLSSLGLATVLVESKDWFFLLGGALGLFVGPAQAAGRSMMARLAPSGLETEAFGLYALSGSAPVFAGPLVLGFVTSMFQSQRAGMSTIVLFFLAGMLLLLPLREPNRSKAG